jgi:hypothetical protein
MVFEPGILKAKAMGFRNGGGDGGNDRNMVRCETKFGGEGGVWEGRAEGVVYERPVQPRQSGTFPFVAPGIEAIEEWELN